MYASLIDKDFFKLCTMLLSYVAELIIVTGPSSCFHDGLKKYLEVFPLGIQIRFL